MQYIDIMGTAVYVLNMIYSLQYIVFYMTLE